MSHWTPNANAQFIPAVSFHSNSDMKYGKVTAEIARFLDDPTNEHPSDRKCAWEFFCLEPGMNPKAASLSRSFNFEWPANCKAQYDRAELDRGIKALATNAGTATPSYTGVCFCQETNPEDAPLACPYAYS